MNDIEWRRRAHALLTLQGDANAVALMADRWRLDRERQYLLAAGAGLESTVQVDCGCAWSTNKYGEPDERLLSCQGQVYGPRRCVFPRGIRDALFVKAEARRG